MPRATILQIYREDGIANFEKYLRLPDLNKRVLMLPQNLLGGGSLGRTVGLAQLIMTWAQSSDAPNARTYRMKKGISSYQDFISSLFWFVAAYFSQCIAQSGQDENIRMDLLRSSRERILAMSRGNLKRTAKGRKVEFILVHGAQHQFHPFLYTQQPTLDDLMDRERHGRLVIDPDGMNNLLRNCIEGLEIWATEEKKKFREYLNWEGNPLGQLLHESFRNTAEHAYLDIEGKIPARGVRCVSIALQQVERSQFKPSSVISTNSPAAIDYFTDVKNRHGSQRYRRKHIDILEISILDSGPGFANTIMTARTQQNDAPSDDVQLVARCFKKHQTAKLGPSSGIGLNRILESIYMLGGFMRLRTSTTESFFAGGSKYHPMMNPTEFIYGNLAEVKGTSLTICFPMNY